jgi:glucokinase
VFLGVDLREAAAVAVAVTESGEVAARASADGPAAIPDAIRGLGRQSHTGRGAAVRDTSDEETADMVAAVAAASGSQPVKVVSRGAAVALAEHWIGAARGAGNVVALVASDRVHAGIILNGSLLEGAHGRAGAASWLAMNPVEREDYRKLGCLEAEAGATGIVRRFVWRVKAGDMSRAAAAPADLSTITVQKILDAARGGDGVAISVVRDTTKYLGMTIGNIVSLFDPDLVVLGGLYAEAADLLIDQSRAEALRRISPRAAESLRVVPATLGDDAAAIGAARAAIGAR